MPVAARSRGGTWHLAASSFVLTESSEQFDAREMSNRVAAKCRAPPAVSLRFGFLYFRRRKNRSPADPNPISARVEGSGTVEIFM